MSVEKVILENLLSNEPYVRRVLPFIKDEYFQERTDKAIFRAIQEFFNKYNALPSTDALKIGLSSRTDLTQNEFDGIEQKIKAFDTTTKQDENWLVDETEKFCKDKAIIINNIGKNKDIPTNK